MLAKWEREIMDDARAYYPGGQAAPALDSPPDGEAFDGFAATFLRLMGTAFTGFVYLEQGRCNAVAFMAFSFEPQKESTPCQYEKQITDLEKEVGPEALRSQAFRIYDGEVVLLVKPDALRFWTRTQAFHDADILRTDEEVQPPHAEA